MVLLLQLQLPVVAMPFPGAVVQPKYWTVHCCGCCLYYDHYCRWVVAETLCVLPLVVVVRIRPVSRSFPLHTIPRRVDRAVRPSNHVWWNETQIDPNASVDTATMCVGDATVHCSARPVPYWHGHRVPHANAVEVCCGAVFDVCFEEDANHATRVPVTKCPTLDPRAVRHDTC